MLRDSYNLLRLQKKPLAIVKEVTLCPVPASIGQAPKLPIRKKASVFLTKLI
uniref:Uncharacterized protein n=1 Tax=Octopus bimaculoides TaxID=37653 RepID=A0A0L8GDN6_OCTBM